MCTNIHTIFTHKYIYIYIYNYIVYICKYICKYYICLNVYIYIYMFVCNLSSIPTISFISNLSTRSTHVAIQVLSSPSRRVAWDFASAWSASLRANLMLSSVNCLVVGSGATGTDGFFIFEKEKGRETTIIWNTKYDFVVFLVAELVGNCVGDKLLIHVYAVMNHDRRTVDKQKSSTCQNHPSSSAWWSWPCTISSLPKELVEV